MLCRRASIGFSILVANVAAAILETEYVRSKQNIVCDGLSRGVQSSELGLDEGLWVHMPEAGPVVQYIRACDPRLPLTTWPQVIDHMGFVSSAIVPYLAGAILCDSVSLSGVNVPPDLVLSR